jgi:prepilin-type N-terminal cleavage/methylation domain-containing protein
MKERKGFNSVELLVVIAVIAILIGILLPAIRHIKSKTMAVACKSNLRQLGICFFMYANNNNDRMFSYTKSYSGQPNIITIWTEEISSYYEDPKLCFCPMATEISNTVVYKNRKLGGKFRAWNVKEFAGFTGEYNASSYGMNSFVSTPRTNPDFWKKTNVKGASEVPLLLDAGWYGATPDSTDPPPSFDDDPGSSVAMNTFCINRHSGNINGVFLDQSVRTIGLKELWKLKWYHNIDIWTQGPSKAEDWPEWMRNFKDY